MTFDEQLQRSLATLSDRLRDEIARAVQTARGEVTAHADAARDAAVNEAAARAHAQAETAARSEIARIEQHAQEMAAASAAREQARADEAAASERARVAEAQARAAETEARATEAQARAAEAAAHQRLVEGVRAIDDARSLSDILDTLIICSSGEAARVAVFLAQSGELHGWRVAGFHGTVDTPAAVVIPAGASGILGDAMRSAGAITSGAAGGSTAPAFARLPDHRPCFAIPISIRGEVVAVLYADQGVSPEEARSTATTAWADALEVFARHATRCLEAATAIKAVGVLTDGAEAVPAAAVRPVAAHAVAPRSNHAAPAVHDSGPDEESAQRYARLLVSEIKLYNESAVVAGRYVRDLGTRLASEIAKARHLYEQQIPPEARTVDHFHNELVRTLANGDASLLGPTP